MIKILELPEDDINRLLALVQREAVTGKIYNTYWAEVADRIILCLNAQSNGVFFQCVACKRDYCTDVGQQYELVEHDPDAVCPGCLQKTDYWLYKNRLGNLVDSWGACLCKETIEVY